MQVSVRKAALQVVGGLVRRYPTHGGLAGVWVRCVLPLIRDPESAVQDAVLEQLSGLVLEPLAALAYRGGGGRGGAARLAATSEEAAAALRPRLMALAHMGRAASSCLARALGVMAARKTLKGLQVAAGVEALLSSGLLSSSGAEGQQEAVEDAEVQPQGRAGKVRRQQQLQKKKEAELALRDAREGAWTVLAEVAGHDPAAPSWQFLQRCWGEMREAAAGRGGAGGSAGGSSQEGAMLLWVISHAASRFPAADATQLATDLLKVGRIAMALWSIRTSKHHENCCHLEMQSRSYGVVQSGPG